MSYSTKNPTSNLKETIILNGEKVLTAIHNYFNNGISCNDPEIINKYDKILDELIENKSNTLPNV